MRVIAGKYRRRVLKEVESKTTRSTKDRVKESIFNSIQNKMYGSSVLDLFAGSGALGIEAISRGASHVAFNELNPKAYKVVEDNIKALKIEEYTVSKLDYVDFLLSAKEKFDVIFLDPPYHMDVLGEIIQYISNKELLSPSGIIVCLYARNNSIKLKNNDIIEYKKKSIGVTDVSFMKWGE